MYMDSLSEIHRGKEKSCSCTKLQINRPHESVITIIYSLACIRTLNSLTVWCGNILFSPRL